MFVDFFHSLFQLIQKSCFLFFIRGQNFTWMPADHLQRYKFDVLWTTNSVSLTEFIIPYSVIFRGSNIAEAKFSQLQIENWEGKSFFRKDGWFWLLSINKLTHLVVASPCTHKVLSNVIRHFIFLKKVDFWKSTKYRNFFNLQFELRERLELVIFFTSWPTVVYH